MTKSNKRKEILLVEDNEGDIELAKEAFEDLQSRNNLSIVEDGDLALDYVFKRNGYEDVPTPDIVLLDLNLPGTNGQEVLEEIKNDEDLKHIPVIVLTSSPADVDIIKSYNSHANWYIVKPVDASKFMEVVRNIENFWATSVVLPSKAFHGQGEN